VECGQWLNVVNVIRSEGKTMAAMYRRATFALPAQKYDNSKCHF
jgi:hypothetical protein